MVRDQQSIAEIFPDQYNFMLAGGQSVGRYDWQQMKLYRDLIKEEHEELEESITNMDNFHGSTPEAMAEVLKEAIDLIVVTAGFIESMGVDPDAAWIAVWESNMSKVTCGGERREDGKILKSPEYKATAKAALMAKLVALCKDQNEE